MVTLSKGPAEIMDNRMRRISKKFALTLTHKLEIFLIKIKLIPIGRSVLKGFMIFTFLEEKNMYFERNAKYDSSKYVEQQSSTVKPNLFRDGKRYGRPKTI